MRDHFPLNQFPESYQNKQDENTSIYLVNAVAFFKKSAARSIHRSPFCVFKKINFSNKFS
jgi:hypothetical protein